jgi:hypothetical protein
MSAFYLDADFSAAFPRHRHRSGYVAKGVIHFRGKPRRVFEANGATISAAEDAAKVKAGQIWRELKWASKPKPKLTKS